MSNEEILEVLEKFKDHLSVGSIFSDPFRWIGWVFVRGLGFILDGLEKVTNEVLLIKKFFQNPEVVTFVDTIRPFLFVLLAFSLLYAGYMLIFQKKFDREGMAINVFIAMIVILLLGTGMEKTNEFTDEAIKAINTTELYDEGEGSLSENIFSRNINDLVEYDRTNWSTTDLTRPNTIPLDMITGISITEKFDSSRDELDMTSDGKDISKKYIVWTATQKDLAKFDQSGLEWNNEYYYRYSPSWVNLIVTLAVMAFTLFSIAYKLARLSFELAFNYVLAIIIAPADVHDGQKTKKIIQSILNTFLVIILIFLSMKIYMIGTAYINNELEGLAYLIALIAFSVAVIDGPNIVERLFGIDAGLKSGWGLLAGAYAGSKMLTGVGKGLANMAKDKDKDGSDEANSQKSNVSKQSKLGNTKAPSPNGEGDQSNSNTTNTAGNEPLSNKGKGKGSDTTGFSDTSDTAGDSGSSSKGISTELEEQEAKNKKTKAPSPNDSERVPSGYSETPSGIIVPSNASQSGNASGNAPTTSGSNGVQKAQGVQKSTAQTDTSVTSVADQTRGNTTVSHSNAGNAPTPTGVSPTSAQGGTGISPTTSGSNDVQKAQGVQKSTVQTDASITSVADQAQGNTTVSHSNTGSAPTPTGVSPTNVQGGAGVAPTTNGSTGVQKATGVQNSKVQTDAAVTNVVEQVQGNTTATTTNTGSNTPTTATPTNTQGGAGVTPTTSGSKAVEKNKVVQNSTVQTDTDVNNVVERVQGNTTATTTNTGSSSSANPTATNVSGGTETKTTSGSKVVEKNKVVQNSTVQSETEVASTIERVQGNTTATTNSTGSSNATKKITERKRPKKYAVDMKSTNPIDRMKNFNRKK